jgi:hypothetical protein
MDNQPTMLQILERFKFDIKLNLTVELIGRIGNPNSVQYYRHKWTETDRRELIPSQKFMNTYIKPFQRKKKEKKKIMK